MAELHLPRLSGGVPYAYPETGRATPALLGDWQTAMEALEAAYTSLNANLAAAVAAQAAADAAQDDAIAAQLSADGKQAASDVLTFLATASAATAAAVKTLLALVKADVGLGAVDNTSDADKPVSTAQQTALDLKAPLASPTFTGTVTTPAADVQGQMRADSLRIDAAPTASAVTTTHTLPVNLNGTTYYALFSNVP